MLPLLRVSVCLNGLELNVSAGWGWVHGRFPVWAMRCWPANTPPCLPGSGQYVAEKLVFCGHQGGRQPDPDQGALPLGGAESRARGRRVMGEHQHVA